MKVIALHKLHDDRMKAIQKDLQKKEDESKETEQKVWAFELNLIT